MTAVRTTPENYLPADEELVETIRRRNPTPLHGASLREIAGDLWAIPWTAATEGGNSIRDKIRDFPVSLEKPGVKGNTIERMSAVQWLREQLQRLVLMGRLNFAHHRRDEVDPEAGVAYWVNEPLLSQPKTKRTPFHRKG